jgi:hypothetical protein
MIFFFPKQPAEDSFKNKNIDESLIKQLLGELNQNNSSLLFAAAWLLSEACTTGRTSIL